MFSFNFLGYLKEEKSHPPVKSLDLRELDQYRTKKIVYGEESSFEKNFNTPLDIGKYQLATLMDSFLREKTKTVEVVNYEELRLYLFIAFKINEFLEKPDAYEKFFSPYDKPWIYLFINRKKNLNVLKKADEKKLGIKVFSEVTMINLIREFQVKYSDERPPESLPERLTTESGWRNSDLHSIIYRLYESLPKSKLKLNISYSG